MIPASYLSATTFGVQNDKTPYFAVGQRVKAIQSPLPVEATVSAVEYDEGRLLTVITVICDSGGALNGSLYEIRASSGYSDDVLQSGNGFVHTHGGPWSGGEISAASLSSSQVNNLKTIAIPVTGDAHKFTVVAPTEAAGYLLAAFAGVTNRTSISWNTEGTIATITVPQDIHTAATPVFAGLTLSGLTGILEAKGATAVGIVAATGSLQVFRRNYANDAYEFSLVDMDELGDTLFTDLAAGAILYRNNASPAKWVNLGVGSDGQALIVSPSTHLPVWGLPTMAIDDLSDATMSGAQDGDLFMRVSGTWTRFPKGIHRQVLAMVGGVPTWVDHNYLAYTTTTAPVTTTTVAVTTTTTA